MARTKIFLLCLILGWVLASLAQNPVYPQITVSVRSSPQISDSQLIDAEKTASRVFEKAGIVIRWMNSANRDADTLDVSPAPTDLSVQLLPHSRNLSDDAFGVSFLDASGGVYADIFLDRVQRLHALDPRISSSRLLGTVVAHELGHLLLGQHSHTERGLMQPRWQREELKKIGQGNLLFDPTQSAQLRARARVLIDRNTAAMAAAKSERGGNF